MMIADGLGARASSGRGFVIKCEFDRLGLHLVPGSFAPKEMLIASCDCAPVCVSVADISFAFLVD
jgi:hypothetical protein